MKAAVTLALCVAFALLLLGCAASGREDSSDGANSPTNSSSPSSGETPVGPVFARAELEPVGDSGTRGTAVFKGVGPADVQVELDVSGLPTKDPDATYYAQVHEGSCSDEPAGEGHEEHGGAGSGPVLALIGFDRFLAEGTLLAKAAGLQAHGGEEPGVPEEPPGSIEQPVTFGASSPDGPAFVTSLLEGVGSGRLASGGPKYIHVHAVRPRGAPEELACGDLKSTKESS